MSFGSPTGLCYMDVFVVGGPLGPGDIPALCLRARALMESCDSDVIFCDVAATARSDAVLVDALAQLQLAAKRVGCEVRVLNASNELEDLIVLMGLRDQLLLYGESGIEAGREAEEREEPLGVEEEADPGDLSV